MLSLRHRSLSGQPNVAVGARSQADVSNRDVCSSRECVAKLAAKAARSKKWAIIESEGLDL